jgi:hypothetical protein
MSGTFVDVWDICWCLGHLLMFETFVDVWDICWCLGHLLMSWTFVNVWDICWCLGHLLMSWTFVDVGDICWCLGHLLMSGTFVDVWDICWCLGHLLYLLTSQWNAAVHTAVLSCSSKFMFYFLLDRIDGLYSSSWHSVFMLWCMFIFIQFVN